MHLQFMPIRLGQSAEFMLIAAPGRGQPRGLDRIRRAHEPGRRWVFACFSQDRFSHGFQKSSLYDGLIAAKCAVVNETRVSATAHSLASIPRLIQYPTSERRWQ